MLRGPATAPLGAPGGPHSSVLHQRPDLLDVDEEFCDKVARARDKLLPLRIGKYGQLQEWALDVDSPEDHHRHIAHLYAVHPGKMIHPSTTPKLAEEEVPSSK